MSLLASLYVLAVAGGEGLLEFHCHPNVGRNAAVGDLLSVTEDRVPVPRLLGLGLGAEPDLAALVAYRTWTGHV